MDSAIVLFSIMGFVVTTLIVSVPYIFIALHDTRARIRIKALSDAKYNRHSNSSKPGSYSHKLYEKTFQKHRSLPARDPWAKKNA